MAKRKSKAQLEREVRQWEATAHEKDLQLRQLITQVAQALFGDDATGKSLSVCLSEIGAIREQLRSKREAYWQLELENKKLWETIHLAFGKQPESSSKAVTDGNSSPR